MKEVKLFSDWVDSITESSRLGTPMKAMADRPLPRGIDIQYKAQRAYPELSPEQALMKYIEDEMLDSDKTDAQQDKKISQIGKEINDVERDEQSIKTDLSKVAHDEVQLQSQLARLINLVSRQN